MTVYQGNLKGHNCSLEMKADYLQLEKVTATIAGNQQRNKLTQLLLSDNFFSYYLLGIFANAKLFLVFIISLNILRHLISYI